MPSKQGDLALLETPVAQQLLQSKIPARLAYNWTDGTPRVVPIWFVWNGREITHCARSIWLNKGLLDKLWMLREHHA